MASPKERIQAFFEMLEGSPNKFFDSNLMRQVKFVDASEGRAEFEFIVTKEMCNNSGTLHGGCAATILDDLTSMPAYTIAKSGFLDEGTMSRTLSCTYLRALRAGEKVKVVCEAVSAGKQFAHFRGHMLTEDGKVAVSCVHDKVVRRTSKL